MANQKLTPLDFEKPLFEMEDKIRELEELSRSTGMNLNGEVTPLKNKLEQLTAETFGGLTAWDRVQLARQEILDRHTDNLIDKRRNAFVAASAEVSRPEISDGHDGFDLYFERHLLVNVS